MTVMFLTMWDYMRGEERLDDFRPDSLPAACAGCGGYFVQPYTDSPLDGEPVGETVYLNLINKAKKYVYLTTPYLIVSDSVNAACAARPRRGWTCGSSPPTSPTKRSSSR